jgi:hypothetical protein
MISRAEVHLRANPLGEHRSVGVVAIEHRGPRLAPYQDIAVEAPGRGIRARVTAIRQRPNRVPHVYADEIRADALVDEEVV